MDDSSDWAAYYQSISNNPTVSSSATSVSSGNWLKDLFAPKAGGTVVGNIIRTVASNATGGILGQGKNMTNIDGTYGNGDNSSAMTDILASIIKVGSQTPQGQQAIADATGKVAASSVTNNSVWLIIIGFMGVIMTMLILKKK